MTFEELRAFLAVVEQGSFLSAAGALGVSRTTLRRQVDALEASAGVPLLRRHRNGVEPTEAGTKLLRGGRVMQQEFNALLEAIRETSHRPSGVVRILLPVGLPPHIMAGAFALARTSWPELSLRVRTSEAPLAGNLSEVDMVVWFGDGQPSGAWDTHTVFQARQRLLAEPGYLASRGTPRGVEDLARHELLAWIAPDESEPRLVTREGRTVAIRPALVSADVHVLHECVQRGAGIGWVPDGGVPGRQERPPLVPLLDELVGRDVTLRLAVPRTLAEVPKVRVFIEHLESMREVLFPAPPPGRNPR